MGGLSNNITRVIISIPFFLVALYGMWWLWLVAQSCPTRQPQEL